MDYKNGKIYKIVNDENDNFYIGSTCSTLTRRIHGHRQKHSKCMSKKLGVDIKDCIIVLVENYSCNDKQELLRKEREYIEKYRKEGLNIMNKILPGRTHKEYHEDNKVEALKKQKEYYHKNKEKILEKKERDRKKVTCDCGSIIINTCLTRHKKSKKHLKYLEELNN